MRAPASIVAPSICEKARIWTLSPTVTPGPNTTLGSITTSRPIFVSAQRKTVLGRDQRRPAVERRGAIALLQDRFDARELGRAY